MHPICTEGYIIIIAAFILLLGTSGRLIAFILKRVTNQDINEIAGAGQDEKGKKRRLEMASIIGKCENIIILCFMILDAQTAIAIVVTAKTIVRKEEIEKNSMFFLAGTLINVSYSVGMGFIVKLLLLHFCK